MKKFFKKPVLLLGSLAAVVGISYISSQTPEIKAQTAPKWCQWNPSGPCAEKMVDENCMCDDQC